MGTCFPLLILILPKLLWIMDTLPTFAILHYLLQKHTYSQFHAVFQRYNPFSSGSFSWLHVPSPQMLIRLCRDQHLYNLGLSSREGTQEYKIRYRELERARGYSSFCPEEDPPPCRATHAHRPPGAYSALYFYPGHNMNLSLMACATQIENIFTVW